MSSVTSNEARKKRVKRMKRMIIFFLLLLIIIPIALCIFLMVRVNKLENKLDKFILQYNNQKAQLASQKTEGTAETAKNEVSVPVVKPNTSTDTSVPHEYDRKVYLTFDDGPSENTIKILDILKQYNVKATFFVVNSDRPGADEIYKRIVAEGHSIGVHSYTHDYNVIYKSMDGFIQDYTLMRTKIYELTGVSTNLYRFPGGSSSPYGNVSKYAIARYLDSLGVTYYDWNVSSADAVDPPISKDEVISNVMNYVMDKKNVMVLMHDSYGRDSTVEALPQIIEQLKAANSEILPITGETEPVQHIFIK